MTVVKLKIIAYSVNAYVSTRVELCGAALPLVVLLILGCRRAASV